MPVNRLFPPEGLRPPAACTRTELEEALAAGIILEGVVQRCDAAHTLHLSLGGIQAQIPRQEAIAPWISGADRDIAVISRVGKQNCFTVKELRSDEKGAPVALLSRRDAQEQAMDFLLQEIRPGTVLTCRVTRLESFGAFVDIGCGIVALSLIHI